MRKLLLFAVLCWPALAQYQTIGVVQTKTAVGSGNTISVTFDTNPVIGNCVVVFWTKNGNDTTLPTVTTTGHTYTQVQTLAYFGTTNVITIHKTKVVASQTFTVTSTVTDGPPSEALLAVEISHVTGTCDVAASAVLDGNDANTVTSSSITPTCGGSCMYFSFLGSFQSTAQTVTNTGTGWTQVATELNGATGVGEWLGLDVYNKTSTGAQSDSWTLSGGAYNGSAIVAFAPAATATAARRRAAIIQ